ncbi:MAG: DinB family protein [Candidatus Promineifilaceae bacterium]
MLDFSPLALRQISMAELAAGLDQSDLRKLTDEMIDAMQALIEGCEDEDVVFVPHDPHAYDEFALDEGDVDLAWTLGHVIVHATASSEEAAFLAAELARGVSMRVRRSRYEVPWERVTTIAQCRQRLEESRRMRLASLDMWPDEPDLDNFYLHRQSGQKINAPMRFLFGLKHDDSHLEQIAEIVRQAAAARLEGVPLQ